MAFRLLFAQGRVAQLDLAPTPAAFASRSVTSTPPRFARDHSASARLVIFVETHRLRTSDAEHDHGVSRKPSLHAIRESRIASSPRDKMIDSILPALGLRPTLRVAYVAPLPRAPLTRLHRAFSPLGLPVHLIASRAFETRSRPRSLAATLAVLPSMSLFPKAPFDLSVCQSASLNSHRFIQALVLPTVLL